MFVQLKKDFMGQKAGFRMDTDEGVAKSLIEQGVAEACATDPLAPIIAKSMEAMLGNLTKTLQETMDATLKEFATAASKSRKNAIPAIFGQGQTGDPKKTFGTFLIAVRNKDIKALEEMGSQFCEWENVVEQKTALSTQTGTQGGFLVPTEFHDKLITIAVEQEVVRKRATHIPMRHRTVQVPILDVITAPSSGDTAFLGGVVARWTEEASALNETEPTFKQLDLTNYELSGYSKISNTLLADSAIGLEKFLYTLFGRAIGWYEDYAFLRGNGVAKPYGILSWISANSASAAVSRSAASAFALADAGNMLGKLMPGWRQDSTCWVMHPTVLTRLIQMNASGTGSDVIFIDNARDKPRWVLMGLPIEVSEKLPALNTLGDVILADCQHYIIGDREKIEIAYSEHVAFLNNQGVWRFVSRVGGTPWMKQPPTLADASSTLSPFVGLSAG